MYDLNLVTAAPEAAANEVLCYVLYQLLPVNSQWGNGISDEVWISHDQALPFALDSPSNQSLRAVFFLQEACTKAMDMMCALLISMSFICLDMCTSCPCISSS